MVYVAPGIYSETQTCVVPPFVSLVGESAAATVITGSISSGVSDANSAVVQLEDQGSLRGLTVENTGSSGISSAIFGADLSRATRIADCVARAAATGGTGHFAVLVHDSDVTLVDCVLNAGGAALLNSAFASSDSGGAFAQPQLIDCVLQAKGVTSGFGLQLNRTAAQVEGCTIEGEFRGIASSNSGISRVRDSEVKTLGFVPVYEQSGSAAILSATTQLIGGNPIGLFSQFKYVHCFKANHDPVVDGSGSDIQ